MIYFELKVDQDQLFMFNFFSITFICIFYIKIIEEYFLCLSWIDARPIPTALKTV